MTMSTQALISVEAFVDKLRRVDAYPHEVPKPVVVHQTHISVVFLAGEFAYKVKKPIKTDFLDYSTLGLRQHYCQEELRLDSRYADDLYLGVVPITSDGERLEVDGEGEAIEYAVKMRRFPEGALLSERIESHRMTTSEVFRLAETVATFHQSANVGHDRIAAQWPDFLVRNVHEIIETLQRDATPGEAAILKVLHDWSNEFFRDHLDLLSQRIEGGFIRSCHGDLHLANVVQWNGELIPFDGIEFNERLQWIDVLSDAAFLAMDFAARGHLDLSRSFMNAYLERTGDYGSLDLLRLFLFYRALVRGLAASMRGDEQDRQEHFELAYRFTLRESPRLWITHGFSGSGKTTLSEAVVQRHEAFRLRSDIERKRLFGLSPTDRPSADVRSKMYDPQTNERTYARLTELASNILHAGYSVILDATFLKRADRQRFHDIAQRQGVPFAILDCHSDPQTLRQRIADRIERDDDASDADLDVLDHQITHHEPLSDIERTFVVDMPDVVQIADRL
ncbi:Zeta toxin [Stieleria bergensis]|uniref:Zeta toxin n=1 Tax=Stieleria bergensis TaxID=2528025 RepID=A0A517SZ08_9BACT|nr:Zeta toxin [Planctomycetes bacterium SV_7m_r]